MNTGYTMGALLETTSGVPFSFPVSGNSMDTRTKFASGLTNLGDILSQFGYHQEFLCGSNASYAGKRTYFEQHGNYEIFDYYTAQEKWLQEEDLIFEAIRPEEAGVSSLEVLEMIESFNRRGFRMHSVLLMKGEKLFCEAYWAPFHRDEPHRMYSVTKSFTAVAVGLCEEDGLIDLDAPIASYFPEKIERPLPEYLAQQTVREMLTMTTAGKADSWFANGVEDRTRWYFNNERVLRPSSTIWEYDSPGSRVLCSLVEKVTGKKMFDYMYERVFSKIGTFRNAKMLQTPISEDYIGAQVLDRVVRNMKDEPLPADDEAYEKLQSYVENLTLYALSGGEDSPMREKINGVEYICEENRLGWEKLSFRFESVDAGELCFTKAGREKVLPFYVNRNRFGLFPEEGYSKERGGVAAPGHRYRDAVSMTWTQDNRIQILARIIDEYLGNLSLTFGFRDDTVFVRSFRKGENMMKDYDGDLLAKKKI